MMKTHNNGFSFSEQIQGPNREKTTAEHLWIIDYRTWIYFAIDRNKNKTITKKEFKKQAKEALMKGIQKQFDRI